ncbi:MAG TPA: hypothetical protein VNI01_02405 [Elusimicrobiota bacterium]|nr:hypothetical protein [Elusimicrobiota bacterium]
MELPIPPAPTRTLRPGGPPNTSITVPIEPPARTETRPSPTAPTQPAAPPPRQTDAPARPAAPAAARREAASPAPVAAAVAPRAPGPLLASAKPAYGPALPDYLRPGGAGAAAPSPRAPRPGSSARSLERAVFGPEAGAPRALRAAAPAELGARIDLLFDRGRARGGEEISLALPRGQGDEAPRARATAPMRQIPENLKLKAAGGRVLLLGKPFLADGAVSRELLEAIAGEEAESEAAVRRLAAIGVGPEKDLRELIQGVRRQNGRFVMPEVLESILLGLAERLPDLRPKRSHLRAFHADPIAGGKLGDMILAEERESAEEASLLLGPARASARILVKAGAPEQKRRAAAALAAVLRQGRGAPEGARETALELMPKTAPAAWLEAGAAELDAAGPGGWAPGAPSLARGLRAAAEEAGWARWRRAIEARLAALKVPGGIERWEEARWSHPDGRAVAGVAYYSPAGGWTFETPGGFRAAMLPDGTFMDHDPESGRSRVVSAKGRLYSDLRKGLYFRSRSEDAPPVEWRPLEGRRGFEARVGDKAFVVEPEGEETLTLRDAGDGIRVFRERAGREELFQELLSDGQQIVHLAGGAGRRLRREEQAELSGKGSGAYWNANRGGGIWVLAPEVLRGGHAAGLDELMGPARRARLEAYLRSTSAMTVPAGRGGNVVAGDDEYRILAAAISGSAVDAGQAAERRYLLQGVFYERDAGRLTLSIAVAYKGDKPTACRHVLIDLDEPRWVQTYVFARNPHAWQLGAQSHRFSQPTSADGRERFGRLEVSIPDETVLSETGAVRWRSKEVWSAQNGGLSLQSDTGISAALAEVPGVAGVAWQSVKSAAGTVGHYGGYVIEPFRSAFVAEVSLVSRFSPAVWVAFSDREVAVFKRVWDDYTTLQAAPYWRPLESEEGRLTTYRWTVGRLSEKERRLVDGYLDAEVKKLWQQQALQGADGRALVQEAPEPTERQRADMAAYKFGWANLPRIYIDQASEKWEKGERAAAVADYAKASLPILLETIVVADGVSSAMQGLRAMTAARALGVTTERILALERMAAAGEQLTVAESAALQSMQAAALLEAGAFVVPAGIEAVDASGGLLSARDAQERKEASERLVRSVPMFVVMGGSYSLRALKGYADALARDVEALRSTVEARRQGALADALRRLEVDPEARARWKDMSKAEVAQELHEVLEARLRGLDGDALGPGETLARAQGLVDAYALLARALGAGPEVSLEGLAGEPSAPEGPAGARFELVAPEPSPEDAPAGRTVIYADNNVLAAAQNVGETHHDAALAAVDAGARVTPDVVMEQFDGKGWTSRLRWLLKRRDPSFKAGPAVKAAENGPGTVEERVQAVLEAAGVPETERPAIAAELERAQGERRAAARQWLDARLKDGRLRVAAIEGDPVRQEGQRELVSLLRGKKDPEGKGAGQGLSPQDAQVVAACMMDAQANGFIPVLLTVDGGVAENVSVLGKVLENPAKRGDWRAKKFAELAARFPGLTLPETRAPEPPAAEAGPPDAGQPGGLEGLVAAVEADWASGARGKSGLTTARTSAPATHPGLFVKEGGSSLLGRALWSADRWTIELLERSFGYEETEVDGVSLRRLHRVPIAPYLYLDRPDGSWLVMQRAELAEGGSPEAHRAVFHLLGQLSRAGVFWLDPHPGNIGFLFQKAGKAIPVIIDYGWMFPAGILNLAWAARLAMNANFRLFRRGLYWIKQELSLRAALDFLANPFAPLSELLGRFSKADEALPEKSGRRLIEGFLDWAFPPSRIPGGREKPPTQ